MPIYKYLCFKIKSNLTLRYLGDAHDIDDLEEINLSASETSITDFGGIDRLADRACQTESMYFRTPTSLQYDFFFCLMNDAVLLAKRDTFRAIFRNDCSITIDIDNRHLMIDLQNTIVNLVLPLYAAWRQLVPVHIGALVHPTGGCVVFSGYGGAGKSTIVAEIAMRFGWKILTEDNTSAVLIDGLVNFHPGVMNLRLWSDSASRLQLPFGADAIELMGTGKTIIKMPERYALTPMIPKLWIDLDWGNQNDYRNIRAFDALVAIKKSLYLSPIALQLIRTEILNGVVFGLLKQTRFKKLERRQDDPAAVDTIIDWILSTE